MTLFVILALLLAVAAVAIVAWPLLRPKAQAEGTPARSLPLAAAMAVWIPLAGFGLYFVLSEWPWDDSRVRPGAAHADSDAALVDMTGRLEARLREQPGDGDGWKLLGRTYVVMGNYPKAAEAYGEALRISNGQDVDAMLGVAEAQVLMDETGFEGEAGRAFERAAELQPDNPKALWYAGLTAYRAQDLQTARQRWTALRALAPPDELLQVIDARLAELGGPLEAAPAPAPAVPAAAPPPAAAASEAAPAGEGIALQIGIAPELAGQVPAGAPLFVLARSSAGGPPLAAVRRGSGELPLSLTLTDADAMIQGTSLSQVEDLEIVARVSLTGRPVQSKGDLFGAVRYDPGRRGPLTVTIDRVAE